MMSHDIGDRRISERETLTAAETISAVKVSFSVPGLPVR